MNIPNMMQSLEVSNVNSVRPFQYAATFNDFRGYHKRPFMPSDEKTSGKIFRETSSRQSMNSGSHVKRI